MLRYLKEAFLARPRLGALGEIPWNLLGVLGASMLGFAEPSIWLAALGLEAAYLYTLATNPRFQNWVDARTPPQLPPEAEARAELVASLTRPARERLALLEGKIGKVEQLYRETGQEDYVFDMNREALKKLAWIYLKLLIAERNILLLGSSDPSEISAQLERIRAELAANKGSKSLRESKQATLALLEQRLKARERRDETLAEIDSDLTRIQAQIDLALDQASLEGRPETISANIDLVSHLLDDSFGEASNTVARLEQTYRAEAGSRLES
jgi:hypothetical protein